MFSKSFIRSFSVRSRSVTEEDLRLLDAFRIYAFGDLPSCNRRTVLEIGCGNGEQTLVQAAKNPDSTFIACDPFVRGLKNLARKAIEEGLNNIHVWVGDVRYLIPSVPDSVISKVLIFFPDPWFKNSHAKRRLLDLEFLLSLSRILADDGFVYFITDYKVYAEQVKAICDEHGVMSYKLIDPCEIPGYVPTKYHRKALMKSVVPIALELCV